jgi:hypothetical protein
VVGDEQGNVLTSINPNAGVGATWETKNILGHYAGGYYPVISDISCPLISFCVGVGYQGETDKVISSADPTSGADAAWAIEKVSDSDGSPGYSYSLEWISCPSASLCFAADNGGNVLVGSSPPSRGSTVGSSPPSSLARATMSALLATSTASRALARLVQQSNTECQKAAAESSDCQDLLKIAAQFSGFASQTSDAANTLRLLLPTLPVARTTRNQASVKLLQLASQLQFGSTVIRQVVAANIGNEWPEWSGPVAASVVTGDNNLQQRVRTVLSDLRALS